MFDLKDLDTKANGEKGAVLKLRHPTTNAVLYADEEKKQPWTLTLVGSDSDSFQKSRKAMIEKAREDGEQFEADDAGIDALVSGTLDCNLILDGKKVLLTELDAIYRQYPWITEQAIQFMADRGNFIKA